MQVDLTWDDQCPNETGFKVERSLSPTSGFAEVAAVGANVESYTDEQVEPETTYYYRVRAARGAERSSYTNVASATTPAADPCDLRFYPSMLYGLTSDSISQSDDTDINLLPNQVFSHPSAPGSAVPDVDFAANPKWRSGASGSAINGLPVIQGGTGRGLVFPVAVGNPEVDNTSWTFYWAGRMPSFPQTTEGHLFGDYRSVVSSAIDGFIVESLIMHAPSGGDNLLGYAYDVQNNNNRITQTTSDNLTGVQVLSWVFDKTVPRCRIYRNGELIFTGTWVTGGGTWKISNVKYELFGSNTVANDQCFFGDTTDLWAATAAHSNATREAAEACLMARLGLTAPDADPDNLVATTVSDTQIDVTWSDNASDETAYQLWRSPDGSTAWVVIATLAAGTDNYSDAGLEPETQYCYRVRALKGTVPSGYSNTDCATTDASTFDPYSLPNQVWMFESDAITPQSDNTNLTLWPDSSGNGNDITFPSSEGGSAAKYRTNHFGSLPSVQAIANTQGETGAVTGGGTASSFTAYLVVDYQKADQTSGFALFFYDNNFGDEEFLNYYLCSDAIGTDQVSYDFLSGGQFDLAAATNGKQVLTIKADKVADTVKLYRNGTLVATKTDVSASGYDLTSSRQWFAINGDGTGQFLGHAGAHFLYKDAHGDTDRAGVEGYLMDKYGIP